MFIFGIEQVAIKWTYVRNRLLNQRLKHGHLITWPKMWLMSYCCASNELATQRKINILKQWLVQSSRHYPRIILLVTLNYKSYWHWTNQCPTNQCPIIKQCQKTKTGTMTFLNSGVSTPEVWKTDSTSRTCAAEIEQVKYQISKQHRKRISKTVTCSRSARN